MQSNEKVEARGGKGRKNPRNSFVPEDNSISNQFLSHNSRVSRVSQQPSSHLSPPNQKNNDQSPRLKRVSRQNENESSKAGKSDKLRERKQQKMQVIHEESINMKMNTPQKPKFKKNTFQANQQQYFDERKVSPVIDIHKQLIQETQSNILDEESVPEEKKMQDLNAGMEKLSESILDLRSKYKQLEQEQVKHKINKIDHKNREVIIPNKSKQKIKNVIFGQRSSQEIERQYKQFLKNQNKEKMARKKVLQQIAEKDRIKLEQQRRQKMELRQAERRQRINEIKQLHNFSEKHKRMKEIQAQRKLAIEQFAKKYQGKEYLAFKKEKQDKQKKKEMLQQQKQYLFDRRQMFKPINFEQIDEHQKWYLDKIQQLNNQKRELKNEELKKIQEQNAEFPEFWRGKAHNIALEERLQKVRRKKQPKEKVKRINEYKVYVRQHFVPRTHQNKSLQNSQLRNESSLTHRQIKRYRYYKGMSYGQVIQTRPIAKSTEEIKRMGSHNFQYMKKLPKKRSGSMKIEAYELKLMQQNRSRVKRQQHFITDQDKKAKNTKIVLPTSVKSDELSMVMKRLKANDEKLKNKQYALNSQPQVLNEYTDQKAINEELIDNIERKLSLLAQL